MMEVLVSLLVVFGVVLIVVAAIGLLRLPDVLCRAHAVAKAATLGIFSLLLALWIALGQEGVGLKILLAIFFQVTTIPVASHLVSLLALQKNIPRWRERPVDSREPAPPAEPPSPPTGSR
ncbi:MAG: monovalent cation/H(+) antiporter subunit G [Verrucomicrobia bacterium]|nr:monovalent cation/H(+) antiporter subunit G [Verrucomicrobiota bacterium]